MAKTLTPNMNLLVPGIGTEPAPVWGADLNTSIQIVDQHNHTPGSGVLITPAALDINTSLSFANNFATNLAGLTLIAQNSTPANNTVYQSGVDLFFVDGLGNDIPITLNGAVAGSPGSISNLTSPASASYVSASKTFVWQSGAGIAANMDAASLLIRNITPNSTNAITIQAPSSLASSYSLVLPSLPAAQNFMTLDNSGNLAAPWNVDNSTITVSSNVIKVPASGITATEIHAGAVTSAKLATNLNMPGDAVQEDGLNLIVQNTNTTTSLSILRGGISTGTAATFAGEGFSVSRLGAGDVLITFTTAFTDTPVILATSGAGNLVASAIQTSTTVGQTRVQLRSFSAALTDGNLYFMAMGQR